MHAQYQVQGYPEMLAAHQEVGGKCSGHLAGQARTFLRETMYQVALRIKFGNNTNY